MTATDAPDSRLVVALRASVTRRRAIAQAVSGWSPLDCYLRFPFSNRPVTIDGQALTGKGSLTVEEVLNIKTIFHWAGSRGEKRFLRALRNTSPP